MVNKKFLILFLALLIVGMSVAVAADVDDSTSAPTKKVTKDTTKVVKNSAVTKKAIKAVDTKTTSKAKKTSEKVRNMTKKDDSKTVKVDVQVDETTSINKKLENNINDDISTVKEDTLNLSKKIIKNVKNDGEPTIIDITAENIEEYFLKDGEAYFINRRAITSDCIIRLNSLPDDTKGLLINNFAINKYNVTVVGSENLELNNLYLSFSYVDLTKNLIINYDENFEYNETLTGGVPLIMSAETDNITINYKPDMVEMKSITLGQTLKNSIINAEVPSLSNGYTLLNSEKSLQLINNNITIEEKYPYGENPSIIGILLQADTNTLTGNNITMNGESTLTAIKLDSNTNTITNNNITVTTTGTATGVELTGNDNTVTDNTIIANDLAGDAAVVATGENNVVQGNGPIATELTVINPSVVNVNEISPMTVILKDAKGNLLANQEINVTVGDESETISTDSSGIAVYEFLPTTSGSADIVFNSISDGMFLSSNKTVTVTVNEDKDAIIEELNKTIQEQKETIASQEEDIEDLNKIIEEQDDEIESLTNTTQALNNTVAQLEKDLTQAQEQLANNNNSNTNGTSNTNTTTPTKTSVTLKVNPTTIYTGSKTKITATLKDANGKAVASQKISIKVGTKTYTVKTNKKGVATKTVKVTKTGKNKVTATFKATKKYAKATKSATLTVKAKEKTKITVSKLSYKNKKITIKATIKAGKKALTQNTKLTIKVDGKTLTAKKTSKKGKISLTLKKALKKGSHKVQIISKATSMYKQSKVTKTLKV